MYIYVYLDIVDHGAIYNQQSWVCQFVQKRVGNLPSSHGDMISRNGNLYPEK